MHQRAAELFQLHPYLPQAGLESIQPWASDWGVLGTGTLGSPYSSCLLAFIKHHCVHSCQTPRQGGAGKRSEDLHSLPGSAVSQLFGLEQVFLGLNIPIYKMRGLDCKISKRSSLFDIQVPSHLLVPFLALLPEPSMELVIQWVLDKCSLAGIMYHSPDL